MSPAPEEHGWFPLQKGQEHLVTWHKGSVTPTELHGEDQHPLRKHIHRLMGPGAEREPVSLALTLSECGLSRLDMGGPSDEEGWVEGVPRGSQQ